MGIMGYVPGNRQVKARTRLAALGAVLLLSGSLGACTSQSDGSASQASADPAKAEATIQALLETVPPSERATVEERFGQFREKLEADYQTASGATGPEQTQKLGLYAYHLLSDLTRFSNQAKDVDLRLEVARSRGSDGSDSLKARAAELAVKTFAANHYLERVRAADPVVSEAVRRHLASYDEQGRAKLSMNNAMAEVRRDPCLFQKAGGAKTTAFSVRGAELGMDRPAALSAVCEMQDGKVELGSEASSTTFDNPPLRALGIKLAVFADFRAGKGRYDQLTTAAGRNWTSPIGRKVAADEAKRYLSASTLCLDCKAPGSNQLELRYDADGVIESIVRKQSFVVSVDEGDVSTTRAAPQKFGEITASLEKQYGKPSFQYVHSGRGLVVYGWSFPDRKSALPPEIWAESSQASVLESNEIKLNNTTIRAANQQPSKEVLNAARPTATYCIVSSGLAPSELFSLGQLFEYANAAFNYPNISDSKNKLQRWATLPYDRQFEISGYTPRCGIAVVAVIKFAQSLEVIDREGRYRAPVIGTDTGVSNLEITLLDIDRHHDQALREHRRMVEVNEGVQKSLDREAQSDEAKFKL
jgi:hypothetical protein